MECFRASAIRKYRGHMRRAMVVHSFAAYKKQLRMRLRVTDSALSNILSLPRSTDRALRVALQQVVNQVFPQSGLVCIFMCIKAVLLMQVRQRIRKRDGIPEMQCAGCEDCCCSFWCQYCTLCQMARHEFVGVPGSGKQYQWCHPTGGVFVV